MPPPLGRLAHVKGAHLYVVLKIGWMRQGASGGSLTDAGGWSPPPRALLHPRGDPVTVQQVEMYRLYSFDI
ncbi:hypothetical protein B5X24_HaOG210229 [Helicoverpa armigera]|nr:hypothetical protein B5X24_HaOG210229 [Helicoverpa armigera]